LRSTTSLIQIIGRAARNVHGRVILYADTITASMERAIDETNRRRAIQHAFNVEHDITPTTIKKGIRDVVDTAVDLVADAPLDTYDDFDRLDRSLKDMSYVELERRAKRLDKEMRDASRRLEFELAAILRDQLMLVRAHLNP
jgi:excinuclease ABC subunit B